jgi:hypothetical protein
VISTIAINHDVRLAFDDDHRTSEGKVTLDALVADLGQYPY